MEPMYTPKVNNKQLELEFMHGRLDMFLDMMSRTKVIDGVNSVTGKEINLQDPEAFAPANELGILTGMLQKADKVKDLDESLPSVMPDILARLSDRDMVKERNKSLEVTAELDLLRLIMIILNGKSSKLSALMTEFIKDEVNFSNVEEALYGEGSDVQKMLWKSSEEQMVVILSNFLARLTEML